MEAETAATETAGLEALRASKAEVAAAEEIAAALATAEAAAKVAEDAEK